MKLFQGINKFPFLAFLDIIDTGDLTPLIIEGDPTEEELEKAWNDLHTIYFEALNSDREASEIAEARDFTISYNRVQRARTILDTAIVIGPHPDIINEFYSFDYNLPENTEKNLDNIIALFTANYKRDYVELQSNTIEKEAETENIEKTIIDSSYYLETIAIMTTSMKCSIDISTLTLGLYVAYVKQYKQHCKSLLKLQTNARN